jgi:hypothetical protein
VSDSASAEIALKKRDKELIYCQKTNNIIVSISCQ